VAIEDAVTLGAVDGVGQQRRQDDALGDARRGGLST